MIQRRTWRFAIAMIMCVQSAVCYAQEQGTAGLVQKEGVVYPVSDSIEYKNIASFSAENEGKYIALNDANKGMPYAKAVKTIKKQQATIKVRDNFADSTVTLQSDTNPIAYALFKNAMAIQASTVRGSSVRAVENEEKKNMRVAVQKQRTGKQDGRKEDTKTAVQHAGAQTNSTESNRQVQSTHERAKSTSMSSHSEYDWRYIVKSVAIINTDKVYFSDVVTVAGNIPQEVYDAIATKVLLEAPKVIGKPFVISEAKMRNLMQTALKNEEIRCIYPNKTVIQRGGYVYTRKQIEQKIKESLFAQMREALQGTVVFSDYRVPEYIFMPSMGSNLVITAEKKAYGRIPVILGIYDSVNLLVSSIKGSVVVRGKKRVPCATKTSSARTPLIQIMQLCEKTMDFIQEDAIWDGKNPQQYRIKRSVAEGDVILKNNIERIPLISKGDIVTLQYKKGSVVLQTLVTALQDADRGESITVQGTNTKKIRATVMSSKEVAVE